MNNEKQNVEAKSLLIPHYLRDKKRIPYRVTSSKKGLAVSQEYITELAGRIETNNKKPIRLKRSDTIVKEAIGFQIQIHNGKGYIQRTVIDEMVGHKAGEFAPTRVYPKHPVKKTNVVKGKKGSGK